MGRGSTPATKQLDAARLPFVVHAFDPSTADDGDGYGLAAAKALGVDPDRVFKTLIALVDDHPVAAVVPVSGKLSFRHLATLAHGKRAEMCPPARAERITGYVVGGISPFGQKQRLPVYLDETAELFDTILVSGGKRGMDIEVGIAAFTEFLDATIGALVA